MDHLPYEIILHIVSFLPSKDSIRLSQVGSKFRAICLTYLTRQREENKIGLNNVFRNMRKYDFYDYYIINDENSSEIFFNLYEVNALCMQMLN